MLNGLLRGAAKDRAEFYARLYGIGALNPNEICQLEDLNPYDGGARYRVPLNMTDPAAAEDNDDAGHPLTRRRPMQRLTCSLRELKCASGESAADRMRFAGLIERNFVESDGAPKLSLASSPRKAVSNSSMPR